MPRPKGGAKGSMRKQSKSKRSPSPVKSESEVEALFLAESIVAVVANDSPDNFVLVKLLEDVVDNSKHIQVLFMKKKDDGSKIHIYTEDVQDTISDKDIITEIEVEKIESTNKRGPKKVSYEVKGPVYNRIKKLAKNFQRVASQSEDEAEDFESEPEPESEEEEEEVPKKASIKRKPLKKVVGKKVNKKIPPKIEEESSSEGEVEEKEEEDEEEEEEGHIEEKVTPKKKRKTKESRSSSYSSNKEKSIKTSRKRS